jgi:hypothetical protein
MALSCSAQVTLYTARHAVENTCLRCPAFSVPAALTGTARRRSEGRSTPEQVDLVAALRMFRRLWVLSLGEELHFD